MRNRVRQDGNKLPIELYANNKLEREASTELQPPHITCPRDPSEVSGRSKADGYSGIWLVVVYEVEHIRTFNPHTQFIPLAEAEVPRERHVYYLESRSG